MLSYAGQFCSTNLDPSLVIDICDRQDKELINLLEERILKTYPNTYTFTKNLAEQTISNNSKGLTVAIVRPSIICASLKEPFPGWLVSFAGQSGIVIDIYKVNSSSLYISLISQIRAFHYIQVIPNNTIRCKN